jgi:hypothetical protein
MDKDKTEIIRDYPRHPRAKMFLEYFPRITRMNADCDLLRPPHLIFSPARSASSAAKAWDISGNPCIQLAGFDSVE